MPERSVAVRYTSAFDPPSSKAGSEARLTPYIDVTGSRIGTMPLEEEEIAVYKPDGTLVRKAKKAVAEQATAGVFKNTFTILVPAGVPPGAYRVTTSLYIDGKAMGSNDTLLQVVMAQPAPHIGTRIAAC